MMNRRELYKQMENAGLKLRQIIRDTMGTSSLMYGTVVRVDAENNIMDAQIGDTELVVSDISISVVAGDNASVHFYPTLGSLVVLGVPYNQSENIFVVKFTQIDRAQVKIGEYTCFCTAENISLSKEGGASIVLQDDSVVMNGGDLGGLIEVEKLTQRLNSIENDINNLKTAFTGWVVSPTDGGAALKAAASVWAAQRLQITTRGDYENENVKQ